MGRAAIPPEARGTMVFGAKDEPRVVGILRTRERSGKGRWVGRLVVLALLLVAFALLLLFLGGPTRSEEHTSELQSLMRISYAVFCLNKKTTTNTHYIASTPRRFIRFCTAVIHYHIITHPHH